MNPNTEKYLTEGERELFKATTAAINNWAEFTGRDTLSAYHAIIERLCGELGRQEVSHDQCHMDLRGLKAENERLNNLVAALEDVKRQLELIVFQPEDQDDGR